MSPVLLDHRNLKLISLSIGVLIAITFFGGYLLGFEKANDKWMANLVPVKIDLPNAGVSALAMANPQPPEFEEPGATIDVDSGDEGDNHGVTMLANNSDAYVETTVIKKVVKPAIEQIRNEPAEQPARPVSSAAITETRQALMAIVSEMDEQPLQNKAETEALSIVEDADAETARYSVQVGMYSDFKNAEAKVEQLINENLNAYLDNYRNKQDEERYNVRFGYFGSFKSGLKALNIYEKKFSGSGYVARIKR